MELVLWDHDGVLVDTENLYFEATRLALSDWDVRLERAEWLVGQARGLRLDQFDFPVSSRPLDFRRIRERRDRLYLEFLSTKDILIDGVEEVLDYVGARCRMGMVTTTSRKILDHVHASGAMLDRFEHIITADDCERLKPDPEPYLKALELFGIAPDAAVAVEDSERGLRAALAAGLCCLVVKSRFMREARFQGAEAVLDSITQVPGALDL